MLQISYNVLINSVSNLAYKEVVVHLDIVMHVLFRLKANLDKCRIMFHSTLHNASDNEL